MPFAYEEPDDNGDVIPSVLEPRYFDSVNGDFQLCDLNDQRRSTVIFAISSWLVQSLVSLCGLKSQPCGGFDQRAPTVLVEQR